MPSEPYYKPIASALFLGNFIVMIKQSAATGSRSRPDYRYRIQFFPALGAGLVAGAVLLVLYYATLGLLPLASSYPITLFPVAAWAHRLDLSQVIGTIARPPYPTPLTWLVGLAIWFGTLGAIGLVYAFLLAWTLQPSDSLKGAGLGFALFFTWGLLLSVSQGNVPSIMRNALPDPGVMLLGWSAWATAQLLTVYVVYGAILGALYRRWTVGRA